MHTQRSSSIVVNSQPASGLTMHACCHKVARRQVHSTAGSNRTVCWMACIPWGRSIFCLLALYQVTTLREHKAAVQNSVQPVAVAVTLTPYTESNIGHMDR